MPVENRHFVNGNPIKPPFPDGVEQALFGMGCFWGAEKACRQIPGVFATRSGTQQATRRIRPATRSAPA